MEPMKHWIILYDIRDVKRLVKVAKVVESVGCRVQKSVFESFAPLSVIERLKIRLEKKIKSEEDFILFLEVCEKDWQKQEKYGTFESEKIQNDKYQIL